MDQNSGLWFGLENNMSWKNDYDINVFYCFFYYSVEWKCLYGISFWYYKAVRVPNFVSFYFQVNGIKRNCNFMDLCLGYVGLVG
jgi:hypothetical protein